MGTHKVCRLNRFYFVVSTEKLARAKTVRGNCGDIVFIVVLYYYNRAAALKTTIPSYSVRYVVMYDIYGS